MLQTNSAWKGVQVEFMSELVGKGPRKHMIFSELSGTRLEIMWSGEWPELAEALNRYRGTR